jgi:hypothetical protein
MLVHSTTWMNLKCILHCVKEASLQRLPIEQFHLYEFLEAKITDRLVAVRS